MTRSFSLADYAARATLINGSVFARTLAPTHDAPARVRVAVHPTTGHVHIQGKRENDKPFLRRFWTSPEAHDWLDRNHYTPAAPEAPTREQDDAHDDAPAELREPDTATSWDALFRGTR